MQYKYFQAHSRQDQKLLQERGQEVPPHLLLRGHVAQCARRLLRHLRHRADASPPPSHHQPMGGLPHGEHRQVVLRLQDRGRHDYGSRCLPRAKHEVAARAKPSLLEVCRVASHVDKVNMHELPHSPYRKITTCAVEMTLKASSLSNRSVRRTCGSRNTTNAL